MNLFFLGATWFPASVLILPALIFPLALGNESNDSQEYPLMGLDNQLSLALVRPFSTGADELLKMLRSFEDWNEFHPCTTSNNKMLDYSVDLFLSFSQNLSEYTQTAQALQEFVDSSSSQELNPWRACFRSIHIIEANIPVDEDRYSSFSSELTRDQMWVNGPNTQFRHAVRTIQTWGGDETVYDAMYVMEADSKPRSSFWLDELVADIIEKTPFTILGSKYHGGTFGEDSPVALLEHLNGNSVYNVSDSFLDVLVDELELEKSTSYNAVPYDYRISQMVIEASTGVVSPFPFPAMEDIDLPTKTAKLRGWWTAFGYPEEGLLDWTLDYPMKESSVIQNFGTANFFQSQLFRSTAIVHGKMERKSWTNITTKGVSLVISDTVMGGLVESLLSQLNNTTHPFSEVVVMFIPANDPQEQDTWFATLQSSTNILVQFQERSISPFFNDLCQVQVSNDWFVIVNSRYHEVSPDIKLMLTNDSEEKPVVPFVNIDSFDGCSASRACLGTVEDTRIAYPKANKLVQDRDLAFHSSWVDSFCSTAVFEVTKASNVTTKFATATSYLAYLESMQVAEHLYSFSDSYKHGSFTNFNMGRMPSDAISNYKNMDEPSDESDIPLFWHVPKSGGTTIKQTIVVCHQKVMAGGGGAVSRYGKDDELVIVGSGRGVFSRRYVNVDVASEAGIEMAKNLGFAGSGLAEVVTTPFLYEANRLLSPTKRGRLFAVFRHPVERASSLFWYLQIADWEATYKPEWANWTLVQYAESTCADSNWMTRFLSGSVSAGSINREDLEAAKKLLEQKFLIGLTSKMEESMSRFEKFFGWKYRVDPEVQETCRESYLKGLNRNSGALGKRTITPGTPEWEALVKINTYDIELYEYAEELFRRQENLFFNISDSFRMIDATCCQCNPATFPEEGSSFECPRQDVNVRRRNMKREFLDAVALSDARSGEAIGHVTIQEELDSSIISDLHSRLLQSYRG